MRFLKTKNQSKASNFMFDHNTDEAFSYGWWQFSGVFNNVRIFNDTFYSVSSNRHQTKAKSFFNNADLVLKYTTNNLTDIRAALIDEVNNAQNAVKELEILIAKPRTRKAKNILRQAEIVQIKQHIDQVAKVLNKIPSLSLVA